MAEVPRPWLIKYRGLLRRWLEEQDEEALEQAYILGREAVEHDISMLDVVAVHVEVTRDIKVKGEEVTKLLGELLLPFEEMLLQTLAGYEMNRQGQKAVMARQKIVVQERDDALKHGRIERAVRDGLMFVSGLAGTGYVTIAHQSDRPALIALFATMMGLPAVLRIFTNGKTIKVEEGA